MPCSSPSPPVSEMAPPAERKDQRHLLGKVGSPAILPRTTAGITWVRLPLRNDGAQALS